MTATSPLTLVLVDSTVNDYESLVENLHSEAEVIILNPNQDGVEQITEALAARDHIENIHILSHGDSGRVYLGSTQLNSETLDLYIDQLQDWQQAFTPNANILLYGCEVAAGEAGQQFVQKLSDLTQTHIAASTNLTGSAALGGDWELEFTTGEIHTSPVFQPEALEAYDSVLATVLLNESFRNNDVTDNTAWLFGKGTGASVADPLLTARTTVAPSSPGGLPGGSVNDPNGAGALRLTNNGADQAAFVIYNKPIASTNGLSITFDLFAYGGSGGADGISFFLFDAAQTNIIAGGYGGSLGYAQRTTPGAVAGIKGGYIGIGFDEFGNYSAGSEGRVNDPITGGVTPDAIAIRGSEANSYKFLTGTGTLTPGIDNVGATNRAAPGTQKTAKIDITPNGTTAVVSVKIDLNGDGNFLGVNEAPTSLSNFTIPLVNGNLPANFKFGFASSTGSNTNFHEIRNLQITDATPGVSFAGTGVTTNPSTGISSVTTIEGGTAQTVSAVLGTRPTSNVTLNLVSTNTAEGTVSVPALTFTSENWDVPQTFTIIPGDDAIADGNIPYTITTTFTSTDLIYTALNPLDISITNFDNEVQASNTPPVVPTITPPAVTQGGTVAIAGLTATDPDGIGFYTITTIPAASQGTLFLGNPAQTGVPVTAGQNLTSTQIGQLFFRAGTGFSGANFTYTATDSLGKTSDPRTVPFAAGNTPPTIPTIAPPALVGGGTVAIAGLTATDPDGIGFYTITTIPAASQGTLFLGDPAQTGVPVTAGQNLTSTQIGQLFFRAGTGFSGANFTYTATDSLGKTSDPRTVSFAAGSGGGSIPREEDVCVPGTPINGTKGNNRLDGADGVSDTIFGKDGDDRLRGFSCEDVLDGGTGNDRILGGTGNDVLRGRVGKDTLLGGAGNDLLNGGAGNDRLDGGTGNDILKGGQSSDLLIGGAGNDSLNGGRGNDRLRGSSGDDTADGSQGNDLINGGGGNDILFGRTGQDKLLGSGGDDTISGGSGNDLIIGGKGVDRLSGNQGKDVFKYRSLKDGGDTIRDFAAVRDSIDLKRISAGRSFGSFVKLNQSGSDTLVRVSSSSGLTTLATLTGVTASTLGASNFVL